MGSWAWVTYEYICVSKRGTVGLGAWYSLGLCDCECPSPCVSSRVSEAVGLQVTAGAWLCIRMCCVFVITLAPRSVFFFLVFI